jgi:hypothetical protein
VSWWSTPENETVTWVRESGLDGRIIEFFEDGVNNQPGEVWGQKLEFLLAVTSFTVSRIAGLNKSLCMLVLLWGRIA